MQNETPGRRLFDYLPPVLQEAQELQILQDKAFQPEINLLWENLGNLFAEQFIASATVYGLARWEGMMGLPPAGSLEKRRRAVLARLREEPPFTLRSLILALEELCGTGKAEIDLDHTRYTLRVRVPLKAPMAAVQSLLIRWIPANISVDIDALYSTHRKNAGYTHGRLAAMTHIGIREMDDEGGTVNA